MREFVSQEGAVKQGESLEWLTIGDHPLHPLWHFHAWSQEEKKSQKSKATPIQHSKIMMAINTLKVNVPKENAMTRFQSTRPLTEKLEGPVLPFLMSLSTSRRDVAAGGLCGFEGRGSEMAPGEAESTAGSLWHKSWSRPSRAPVFAIGARRREAELWDQTRRKRKKGRSI